MLDFGKNAFFIWSSYGISAVIIGALIIHAWRSPKQ